MLKQQLQLKLSQKLSPQQIQLMKLIQLPTLAFEERLKQEIEENPALEQGKESVETDELYEDQDEPWDEQENETLDLEDYLSDDDVPDYKTTDSNYPEESKDHQIPYAAGTSFHQHLISQLGTFEVSESTYLIAEYLIGSLDESGYLRRPEEDLIDDMAFHMNLMVAPEELIDSLHIVQQLDPAGVGARNIAECLKLQLERQSASEARDLAMAIIRDSFDLFSKKHFEKLQTKHKSSEELLKEALTKIEKLNPKPGASFANQSKTNTYIIPDFTIRIEEDQIDVLLNARNAPELHVSKAYQELIRTYQEGKPSKEQKETVQFVKQKLDSAKWFIDAIKQRQNTLLITMNAIVQHQRSYFLSGDERDIQPMILKDIAEAIGMDVSTVSRVANSKYADTPYGTKLLKTFFSDAMTNEDGETVSTRQIKSLVRDLIDAEDKKAPLTDDQIGKVLKEKGFKVARRTVAKYREQLDLPVARLRRSL
ncbi:MAG: RNA polymerase factor sigma-54 [Flavobacteriaceae bacterium]|nr:RNA polymerase factor sigma-54 [Flavobacteriaceae bacterium]